MNAYFGNNSVKYVFFSWFRNMTCDNACSTDKTTLLSIICDLWCHKFVMLKLALN